MNGKCLFWIKEAFCSQKQKILFLFFFNLMVRNASTALSASGNIITFGFSISLCIINGLQELSMDYPELDIVACRLLCAVKPDYHWGKGKTTLYKIHDYGPNRTPDAPFHVKCTIMINDIWGIQSQCFVLPLTQIVHNCCVYINECGSHWQYYLFTCIFHSVYIIY